MTVMAPVAVFFSSTRAPATAAPLGSVTVPTTEAEDAVCACALPAHPSQQNTVRTTSTQRASLSCMNTDLPPSLSSSPSDRRPDQPPGGAQVGRMLGRGRRDCNTEKPRIRIKGSPPWRLWSACLSGCARLDYGLLPNFQLWPARA